MSENASEKENAGRVLCFRCGQHIPENNLGRQDSCAGCGADTRVCRNCLHYDRAYNNECREEQAPRQVEKEKRNFCEWFQPRKGAVAGQAQDRPASSLRSAADALFGGNAATKPASAATPADQAKAAAEALFKKKS